MPDFRAAGDGYLLSSRADQKRGGVFFAASFESIGSIDKNNKSIAQILFEFCFVFLVFYCVSLWSVFEK